MPRAHDTTRRADATWQWSFDGRGVGCRRGMLQRLQREGVMRRMP